MFKLCNVNGWDISTAVPSLACILMKQHDLWWKIPIENPWRHISETLNFKMSLHKMPRHSRTCAFSASSKAAYYSLSACYLKPFDSPEHYKQMVRYLLWFTILTLHQHLGSKSAQFCVLRSISTEWVQAIRNRVNAWDHMLCLTSRCFEQQFGWSTCASTWIKFNCCIQTWQTFWYIYS